MRENFELILEKEWLNCLMVGNSFEITFLLPLWRI